MTTRYCEGCGCPYEDEETAAEKTASFCCVECEERGCTIDLRVACQQCGGDYIPPATDDDGFCSDGCMSAYQDELSDLPDEEEE